MFVSGNPTLPSKTPRPLSFLGDFEKYVLKIGEKSVKNNQFLKKTNTYGPYRKLFEPLPETDMFF